MTEDTPSITRVRLAQLFSIAKGIKDLKAVIKHNPEVTDICSREITSLEKDYNTIIDIMREDGTLSY